MDGVDCSVSILLIDKKPGMMVHPDDSEKLNTLITHVRAYLYQKGEYIPEEEQSFAPALCNRIDRNTGGIVIAAKNAESLRILCEKIKERQIDKRYLAVVHGVPKEKADEVLTDSPAVSDKTVKKIKIKFLSVKEIKFSISF